MRNLLFTIILLFQISSCFATLSIVAVDPATGKVGAAGFTCICSFNLSNAISVVVPNKGVFDSQASHGVSNIPNARTYLNTLSATEIINKAKIDLGSSRINTCQLLCATLKSTPGSTTPGNAFAFTGAGNSAVNSIRYGANFAVAGNILLSQAVIDDAFNAFQNTKGELEDKLMAALIAARRAGADSRCLSKQISSDVAFISVAKPTDMANNIYLNLQYSNSCGTTLEPVNELNKLFTTFKRIEMLPKFNITSITAARQSSGDMGYTFDGSYMNASARPKLSNTQNISTPYNVKLIDVFGNANSITEVALNNAQTDLFFIGSFDKNGLASSKKSFTTTEIDEAYKWSLKNNHITFLFESGDNYNSFFSKWGYSVTKSIANPCKPSSTINAITNIMFNGVFGSVTDFNQGGGTQSYFSTIPTNSIILAVNANNKPVIAFDCTTRDILCADGDVFTSLGGISTGNSIINNNDRLLMNMIDVAYKLRNNSISLPCQAISSARIIEFLEEEINGVLIFPNPTSDIVNIKSETEITSYRLYDLSGKILLENRISQDNVNIDIKSLQSGEYIIILLNEDIVISKHKIIKN
ncbi:DUF1028 domain-containing protein [Flectobacillus roseus]|uniref:DUF1028 domain-containing protein n=1 Tax=Flectobacillus roseus TaxID=502259 RepID=UPI0024B800E2|nr:DUF1028 domain-containing protein [Flectobacillus roseus]MDI9872624.1 DUF1028 domain-containing protein [Flectobacillus roseus]